MSRLSYLSLVILCAVSSQGIVAVSDKNNEAYSAPHSHQIRIQAYKVPAPKPYRKPQNLRELHMKIPFRVQITVDKHPLFPAFAIHPYIIMAHHSLLPAVYGVSSYEEYSGKLIPALIRDKIVIPEFDLVLIELKEPILLTKPVRNGLHAAGFLGGAISTARAEAEKIILRELTPRNA